MYTHIIEHYLFVMLVFGVCCDSVILMTVVY